MPLQRLMNTLLVRPESRLGSTYICFEESDNCYIGLELDQKIPTHLIAEIFEEWKVEYGPTYPLYGNETKRSDISGSIRPLLSSTEISHIKVLSAMTGLSKKKLENILNGIISEIDYQMAEKLVCAMDHEWEFYWGRLEVYY